MALMKECPLCGGSMQIKETETAVRIPGYTKTTVRKVREWICPDCDYFEEAVEIDEG